MIRRPILGAPFIARLYGGMNNGTFNAIGYILHHYFNDNDCVRVYASDSDRMRWTSRKFWAMWAFVALFWDMRSDKLISGDQFVSLVEILIIAYFAANVVKAGVDKWKGGFNAGD